MKFQILSPEIGHKNAKMSHDYWVRKDIEKAALEMGHDVLPVDTKTVPDIQFVMWGMKPRYKVKVRGKLRALWLCSRPYHLPRNKFLSSFDRIYALTEKHRQSIWDRRKVRTFVLSIASSKQYSPATKAYQHDITYMGTYKEYRAVPLLRLAHRGKSIGVVGCDWEKVKHINLKWYGEWWPNEEFSTFYNLAPLSVYPTDSRYIQHGVVPIRICDIYVGSDCLCITRGNPGLKEVFTTLPPTYQSERRLAKLVDRYLSDEKQRCNRQELVRRGFQRTYVDLLRDLMK